MAKVFSGKRLRLATMGLALGGAAGGLAGREIGGAGGLVIGALTGILVGHLIAEHLNMQERERYEAGLAAKLKEADPNRPASNTFRTQDGTVQVRDEFTPSVPVSAIQAQGATGGLDQNRMAKLGPGAVCHRSSTIIKGPNGTAAEEGVYCRTPHGDYIRVDAQAA